VTEAAQTRIDEQTPRVVVLTEDPPDAVPDRHRSAMPGGGEPTLFETLGQSEIAGAQAYYFDTLKSWFLGFLWRLDQRRASHGQARLDARPALSKVNQNC
jgi:hypothetical protein